MFCMMMLAAVAGFRAPVEKPVENERGDLWGRSTPSSPTRWEART